MFFALLPLLIACNNDCSFTERCDGDVLQVCGSGVDQMFGREVHETPCADLNPVCVEIDASNAMCAADPATPCDIDTFDATCDGDVLTACSGVQYTESLEYDTAYVVMSDCASAGYACDETTGTCN